MTHDEALRLLTRLLLDRYEYVGFTSMEPGAAAAAEVRLRWLRESEPTTLQLEHLLQLTWRSFMWARCDSCGTTCIFARLDTYDWCPRATGSTTFPGAPCAKCTRFVDDVRRDLDNASYIVHLVAPDARTSS